MQTIVALSTGPAHGAIAMVRLSGAEALAIAERLFRSAAGVPLSALTPRSVHFGELWDGDAAIDQVVTSYYQAPHSYTGEDVVEFSCHGSSYVVERLLQMAVESGARLAKRGEFTRRAFLNGKMDLVQAEAVADLINAQTAPQAEVAFLQLKGDLSKDVKTLQSQLLELAALLELELDFSEEDVEFADRTKLMQLVESASKKVNALLNSYTAGNALREGVRVVIAGAPNAGKSSLLNALAREEVALVSDIPGTTRDAIETTLRIGGLLFRLIDTAGLRVADDPVERMGVARAEQRIAQASVLMVVVDSTLQWECVRAAVAEAMDHADSAADVAVLLSKSDLSLESVLEGLQAQVQKEVPRALVMRWAAPTHRGEEDILEWLSGIATRLLPKAGDAVVTSVRHVAALSEAQRGLHSLTEALENRTPTDILAFQLRESIDSLAAITGEVSNDAVLDYIFSRFCIGK